MREAALRIRLLGPVTLTRRGVPVPLPPSRKVRALLAFLAVASGPVTRSRLCDLLWDIPDDPRGELRWCLSKLRGVLDDPERRRVVTAAPGRVELDLSDCVVDALEVETALRTGFADATGEGLGALRDLFGGEFLEGLQIDGNVEMGPWLAAQRQRYRAMHGAVLARVAKNATPAQLQPGPGPPLESRPGRRASVAIMPFVDAGDAPGNAAPGRLAEGLTEDIITRLAKLRVLFVIARGTVYALGERGVGAGEAGRLLNVEYVVSGRVRREKGRVAIAVELAETQNARIVWTDEFDGAAGDTFAVIDTIVNRVVAAVAEEITTAECQRAILKAPSSLDAWEAYHRGLWHMYKFNGPDNVHAETFFRGALDLDPTFSRAHAGLSFAHFQNAFLDLTPDRDRQIELAFESAGRSVGADDRDPAAHWAMGRAYWLRGVETESLAELERSVELSPNFALGHYTLGFVGSQSGDPRSAIDATDRSRELSPFDPLQFAMLASRALAHVRLGELDEAADWAVKASGRPNAHAHILAIAAECLALAQRRDEARAFVGRIRQRVPNYDVGHFLRAFRFDRETETLFRRGARRIGFEAAHGERSLSV